jgi:hypothetical protein
MGADASRMKMKSKASLWGLDSFTGGWVLRLIRLCRRWVRSGDRRNLVLRVHLWRIVSGRYTVSLQSISESEWLVLRLVGAG